MNQTINVMRIKMKSIFVMFGYVIFNITSAGAQVPDVFPRSEVIQVPPSPKAAQLGTYGDLAVSKATGAADISIPIHTIEEGGISIPITLSYQSAGLRVDDRPSYVGMGWILSAGGVINRTMRGRVDEMHKGYLSNVNDFPDDSQLRSDLGNESPGVRDAAYNKLDLLVTSEKDFIPDLFSFNFGAYGGSFIISDKKEEGNSYNSILIAEHKPLKIKYVRGNTYNEFGEVYFNNVITEWHVTDEKGLIYKFTARETTRARGEEGWDQEYISAWYLTSITNPLTNTIASFEYYESEYGEPGYTYSYEDIVHSMKYKKKESDSWYILTNPLVQNYRRSEHRNLKFLKKITLGNNDITFIKGTSYETSDVGQNYHKLDSIFWKNDKSEKSFAFNYSYFKPSSCTSGPGCKRLRLDSFMEEGVNAKTHDFDYYAGDIPEKRSYAQDHWGYYNGASNSSLIPDVLLGGKIEGKGANREPDLGSAQIGMLKKITYPTSGTTTFSYEQNTWEDATIEEDVITVIGTGTFESTGSGSRTKVCEPIDWIIGTPNLGSDYKLSYNCRPLFSGLGDVPDGGIYPTFTVTDLTTSNVVIQLGRITEDLEDFIYLTQGHIYAIELCAFGSDVKVIADLKLEEIDNGLINQPIERPVGGLRLSRLENWDPISETAQIRTFDYENGGYLVWRAPNYLSGHIVAEPTITSGEGIPSGRKETSNVVLSSAASGGLGPSSLPVAYEKVTEWLGTKELNNGYTVTKFLKNIDYTSGLLPQISNHYIRTKVRSQNYYNNLGFRVKSENFNYETEGIGVAEGFIVKRLAYLTGGASRYYETDFNFSTFFMPSSWWRLASKATIEYSSSGAIENNISYDYSTSGHLNPVVEEVEISNGAKLRTEYTYPSDVQSNDPDIAFFGSFSLLNTIGVQSSPVKVETFKVEADNTTNKLSSAFAKYDISIHEKPVLGSVWRSFRGNDPQLLYAINDHDINANPLEIEDKDGVITSYLWGYDNAYLIAEIKNSNYSQVQTALNGQDVTGLDGAELESVLNGLRQELSPGGAFVTSYTYQPGIGVTSVTDPNGVTTHYNYDDLGRLKVVKDFESNVLQKYEYNYRK